MRPKKLTLCAWGPYRDKQEIDFEAFSKQGIFLITGATGAGKTTLFDAISYALYGALSGHERDKERNSVRSDFALPQTPTYVELLMEHGGKEYRIVRNPEYMRPKKRSGGTESFTKEKDNAVLYYPDGRIVEGTREVNAAMLDLLVLDYEQFKKISMIAQGEFAKLLVASPKDKTKIFREIFGTGVYEKFTQNLSQRARKLYGAVQEQLHKLSEDVEMISMGLDRSVWPEETKERFRALTAVEKCNYEEVRALLEQMEHDAAGALAAAKADFEKADQAVTKLSKRIAKEEEEQKKRERLEQVTAERESLKAAKPVFRDKEKSLTAAVNAGFVESAEQQCVQAQKRIAETEQMILQLQEQSLLLAKEAESLERIVSRAQEVKILLEVARQWEETKRTQADTEKQLQKARIQLEQSQSAYVEQEKLCEQWKKRYEEEDRRRKHSAIGLAASLLEEGQPCPVCGSTEHPSPAKVEDGVISEQELQQLKKRYETADRELRNSHEAAVSARTLYDSLQEQAVVLQGQQEQLRIQMEQAEDEVCAEFLRLPVRKAIELLSEKCQRAGVVAELIQDKEERRKQCIADKAQQEDAYQEAEAAFREALVQYGFAKEAAYRAAKMSKSERDLLQQELETYRSKVAANEELYKHLKETVKKKAEDDIGVLREQLAQTQEQKSAMLKAQRDWEKAHSEVKKTKSLVTERLRSLEEATGEYGYVKDLENMAVGNNAQKLVFEQYVLAGYFEEILKAANIRFRKMSAGRFEMSRPERVGDGRVKDNLEIQVMDYYTGKFRSVRTLSGGESFKASLSLALGMSDVIQSMNGGIRVDTLFVDEGFGALDEESLDQACSTLMSLAEKNCLIGIISHVPELRERIGQQLIIEKTSSGSLVKSSVK